MKCQSVPPDAFDLRQRRGPAGAERGEQARHLLAARRGPVHRGEDAEHEPAPELRGQADRVEGEMIRRAGDALPAELLHHPSERRLGLGQRAGAAGERLRLQPVRFGKMAAHARAVEALVFVAWIGDRIDAGLPHDRRELLPSPAEQGPDERRVDRADPGEARQAGAAREAHDQGLGLVVEMMAGGEEGGADLAHPLTQQRIAARPRRGLDIGGLVHLRAQDGVGNVPRRAQRRDERSFGGAFGAEAVIDGRRVDAAWIGGLGKEQQGEAVGAARDGEAEPLRRPAGQRFEIGAEAGDRLCHGGDSSRLARAGEFACPQDPRTRSRRSVSGAKGSGFPSGGNMLDLVQLQRQAKGTNANDTDSQA